MIIYKVTNNLNGNVYIGQTSKTLEERRSKHEKESLTENRKTVKFHNALQKYGFENFTWEILKTCSSQEQLDFYEEYYIQKYNSLDREKGYNLKHGGKFGGCYSEEARVNMGEASKKKWKDPGCASKMLAGLRKGTETVKQKAKEIFVEHICPVCGKSFKTKNWDSHIYCSLGCANKANVENGICTKNLELATAKNKEKYSIIKEERLKLIYNWLEANSNLVLNAKLNNLKFLEDLCIYIGVKDTRSLGKVLDVKYKKEIINKLKEIIENVRRTSPK